MDDSFEIIGWFSAVATSRDGNRNTAARNCLVGTLLFTHCVARIIPHVRTLRSSPRTNDRTRPPGVVTAKKKNTLVV